MRKDTKEIDLGNGRGRQLVSGNFIFGIGFISHFAVEADRALRAGANDGGGGSNGNGGDGANNDDDEYAVGDVFAHDGHTDDDDGDGEDYTTGARAGSRVRHAAPVAAAGAAGRTDVDGVDGALGSGGALGGAHGALGSGGAHGGGAAREGHGSDSDGALWTEFLDKLTNHQQSHLATPTADHIAQIGRVAPFSYDAMAKLLAGSKETLTPDMVQRFCSILKGKLTRV